MSADKFFTVGKGKSKEIDMEKLADKIRSVKASSSSWINEVQDKIAAVGQGLVAGRDQVRMASAPARTSPLPNNQMYAVDRIDQGQGGPRDIRAVAAQDRDRQINNIVARAREILQKKIAEVPLSGADVYYMQSDISRWDDQTGTPQTGRLSFQIPFSGPGGGPRTIYANVDIVLGDPMSPRYFSDGMNHHYAFDKSGLAEMLQGSEFDVVQTPHVVPEQKMFGPEFHSPDGIPGQVAAVDGPRIVRAAVDMTRQACACAHPRHVAEGLVRPISKEAAPIPAPLSPNEVQEIKDKPKAEAPRQPAHAISNYPGGAESNIGYPQGDQTPGHSTLSSQKARVVVAASGMSQVVDDLKLMDMRMISFRDLVQLLKQHGQMSSVDFDNAAESLAKEGIILFRTAGVTDSSLGRRVARAHAQRLAAPAVAPEQNPAADALPSKPEAQPEAKPQGQAGPAQVPQQPAPEGEAEIAPPNGMDTVEFKEWNRLMDEWHNEKATMSEREENNVKNGLAPETGIDYTNLQLILDKIKSMQSSIQGRATQELQQDAPADLAAAPKTAPGAGAGAPPVDGAGAPQDQTLIPEKGKGLAADRRRVRTALDQALDMREQGATILDGVDTIAGNTANVDAATGGGSSLPKTAAYELDDEAKTQMASMGMDSNDPEKVKEFMGTYKKTASHSQKFPEVCKNCKHLMVPVGYSALREFKHTRLPICGAAKSETVGFRFAYFRECAAYEPIVKDLEQAVDSEAPASEQKEGDEKKVVKPICERRAGRETVAVAPPGLEHVVKELKKDPKVDNPFAVAWSIKDKQDKKAGAKGFVPDNSSICKKCGGKLVLDQAQSGPQGNAYVCQGCGALHSLGRTAAALPSADPKSVKDKESQTGHGLDVREWCKSHGHYAPVGECHPTHDYCTLWNTSVENLVMLPSGAVVPKSLAGMSSEPQGEGGPRQFSRDMDQSS